MPKKYVDSFRSDADGLEISVMKILPDTFPCRGILQLVHGMSEHKERYESFMEYMAEQGFVTVIHDHRGHGGSVREKGDLGYMYGGGADAMLKDISKVNREIKKEYPDIPLILMGHSMGSLAVRAFAAQHDDCMDMLVVCGSPSENKARFIGEIIAKSEEKVFGAKHRSAVLEIMSLGGYAWKFRKEKNKNAWICSDKEVYEAYTKSELCGFTFTDDAYLALFELMKRAYDIRNWHCTRAKMPVLFISGEKDPCMGNIRKFANSVHAMRRAGYLDVKGKVYPGMRHEILNEKGREKVYHDIAVYIRKKGF